MADISFADVKVHNEVEFCTITDLNVKKQLERLFLDERISYYEKWDDVRRRGKIKMHALHQ